MASKKDFKNEVDEEEQNMTQPNPISPLDSMFKNNFLASVLAKQLKDRKKQFLVPETPLSQKPINGADQALKLKQLMDKPENVSVLQNLLE